MWHLIINSFIMGFIRVKQLVHYGAGSRFLRVEDNLELGWFIIALLFMWILISLVLYIQCGHRSRSSGDWWTQAFSELCVFCVYCTYFN
eukprot:UN03935